MPPATIKHISPMLAAANLAETLAFYHQALGFSIVLETDGYAIIERDGQTIHLSAPATEETLASMRKHTAIYTEVTDLFALWEQVQPFVDRSKVRDPFDRDYGMTEFHLFDPNGCLLFVGELTSAARPPQP